MGLSLLFVIFFHGFCFAVIQRPDFETRAAFEERFPFDGHRIASRDNTILLENNLEGTPSTEWEINGAGDASIQGFAHPFSLDRGQVVKFRVKVDNATEARVRVDVYRLGYYGGQGARRVASILEKDVWVGEQPACRRDKTTGLHDCIGWRVACEWRVDSLSGVYFARFTRTDSSPAPTWRNDNSPVRWDVRFATPGAPFERPAPGPHRYGANGFGALRRPIRNARASHAYFVVRSTEPTDILMQTLDQTWQAYNDWAEDPSDYASTYGSYPGSLPPESGKTFNPRIHAW